MPHAVLGASRGVGLQLFIFLLLPSHALSYTVLGLALGAGHATCLGYSFFCFVYPTLGCTCARLNGGEIYSLGGPGHMRPGHF